MWKFYNERYCSFFRLYEPINNKEQKKIREEKIYYLEIYLKNYSYEYKRRYILIYK